MPRSIRPVRIALATGALAAGLFMIWGAVAPAATTLPPADAPVGAPTGAPGFGSGTLDFAVHYGRNTPLGEHKVTISQAANGDILVDVDIRFQAKVLMVTAFRYHHVSHEVWRAGRLVSLNATTDDNGDKDWVKGQATPEGFAVDSSRGHVLAPADIIPTSYWNPATLTTAHLLDTVRGEIMGIRVERQGTETVPTADGRVTATHYVLDFVSNPPPSTDHVDVWYDGRDRWVKMAFHARGHDIAYTRQPAQTTQVATSAGGDPPAPAKGD